MTLGEFVVLLLSEAPGEPSARRVALLITVVATLAICGIGVFRGIPDHLPSILIALNTSAFAAAAVGRFAENGGRQ